MQRMWKRIFQLTNKFKENIKTEKSINILKKSFK